MKCPSCENHIDIEDYDDDEPFPAPCCGEMVVLDTDEGSYCGAAQKQLVIFEE